MIHRPVREDRLPPSGLCSARTPAVRQPENWRKKLRECRYDTEAAAGVVGLLLGQQTTRIRFPTDERSEDRPGGQTGLRLQGVCTIKGPSALSGVAIESKDQNTNLDYFPLVSLLSLSIMRNSVFSDPELALLLQYCREYVNAGSDKQTFYARIWGIYLRAFPVMPTNDEVMENGGDFMKAFQHPECAERRGKRLEVSCPSLKDASSMLIGYRIRSSKLAVGSTTTLSAQSAR